MSEKKTQDTHLDDGQNVFTFQTLEPIERLVVGFLPKVAGPFHLPAQELGALGLLGERRALVKDRLEHLPLLVQLVDHLRKKGRLGIFLRVVRALKFSVKPRLDCNLGKLNIPITMPVQFKFIFLFLISQ